MDVLKISVAFRHILTRLACPHSKTSVARFKPMTLNCCYCGIPANTCDHIVPVSWTGKKRKGHFNAGCDKNTTVASCHECNGMLSNYHLHTIGERAAYLSERLTQRYKKELESPFWSEEEIQELGKTLRTTVMRKQLKKHEVVDRIRHCNHVSKLDMTIEDYWSSSDT